MAECDDRPAVAADPAGDASILVGEDNLQEQRDEVRKDTACTGRIISLLIVATIWKVYRQICIDNWFLTPCQTFTAIIWKKMKRK